MTTCSAPNCSTPVLAKSLCGRHYQRMAKTGSLELAPSKRVYPRKPLEERFWSKVEKTDGCWLWTGGATSQGYGMISKGGREGHFMAHRVSWELANGPIPDGLHIDHLCMVPRCVNPAHLEPVTLAENTRRGYAPSIAAGHQAAKTECPNGHPYDESNTYVTKRGGRMCKTCIRIRQRAQRAARAQGVPYVDPFSVPG